VKGRPESRLGRLSSGAKVSTDCLTLPASPSYGHDLVGVVEGGRGGTLERAKRCETRRAQSGCVLMSMIRVTPTGTYNKAGVRKLIEKTR